MTKISVEMAIYAENSANIAKTLLHKWIPVEELWQVWSVLPNKSLNDEDKTKFVGDK
jgi:hypothetical protein